MAHAGAEQRLKRGVRHFWLGLVGLERRQDRPRRFPRTPGSASLPGGPMEISGIG